MTPPVSESLCRKGLWLVKGGGEEFLQITSDVVRYHHINRY